MQRVSIFIASIILWTLTASSQAEIALTGDTSKPTHSVFIAGEPVVLTFSIAGLAPNDTTLSLHSRVVDEQDKTIEEKSSAVRADAAGRCAITFTGPNAKLGFYRVYAKLSNDVTIRKTVSRPEGYITYCVIADPSTRRLYPAEDTFFGIYGGLGGGLNAFINPAFGFRWDIGIWGWGWGNIESDAPGQATQRFDQETVAVKKQRAEGKAGALRSSYCIPSLYIIPTKWKTPPFVKETLAGYTATLTPDGEKQWDQYCRTAARAYAEQNPDRTERFYQITWEPIVPWGFKGTDEDIVRIHEIAHRAIHDVDPKAIVFGPTVSNIGRDVDLMQRLLDKGLGKVIDGVSIHPYSNMPPEQHHFRELILQLKEMTHKYVGKTLPMLSTEQGFATGEKRTNELLQAQGLVRSNLIMLGEGFRMNIAFYLHDYLCEQGYGFFYNLNPAIDYGTDKIAPKPIAPAYAAMTALLEGKKSAGAIDWLSKTTLGYAYERDDDVILALWDFGDLARSVTLPVGVANVAVYDWMGNRRDVRTEAGVLTIDVGPEPIYIAGVSPKLWSSRATKPIQIDSPRITSYPSRTIEIRGSIVAAEKPLQGTLTLSCDSTIVIADAVTKSIRIGAGKRESFTYSLTLPANIAPAIYPVTLNLCDGSLPIASAGCAINVEPPVTIETIDPCLDSDGRFGLQVTLKELTQSNSTGTLAFRIVGVPETRKTLAYTLPPHQTQTFRLNYDTLDVSPIRIYPTEVTLTTASGYTLTKSTNVNFFAVPRVPTPIRIDGDLTEWSSIAAVSLRGLGCVIRNSEFYTGDNDQRADVRFAYDEKNLYIAIDAVDDVFWQRDTGYMTWRGDCVQLAIDLDARKEDVRTGNDLADKGSRHRTSEITLALTAKGPEAYRTMSFDEQKLPIAAIASNDLPLVVKHIGTHLIYEAAIPWRTLGSDTRSADPTIGFAISINDSDAAEQVDPSAVGAFELKDARKFGRLLLKGVAR